MKSLHGNTQGLKPNQLRRIEKLYQRRIPPHEIVTPEFARQISELSHEIRRQIGVLINRQGYVEFVIVGDARQIELPDFKRVRVAGDRFRGLRCVHTHLRGEDLTRDDLTDLALLRLDLMAAIDVDEKTGLPGLVRSAHLLPPAGPESFGNGNGKHFGFLDPAVASQLEVDFLGLIEALESEMARNRRTSRSAAGAERAILVNVSTGGREDTEDSMAELRELAQSAGVVVLDEIIQRRSTIDPRTVLGKGKLEELLISAMQAGADAIIFDRELQPAQVRSISEAADLKVIDRSQLILDIFAQRAQSHEGKIQVELAQLKYILPRLVIGQNSAFSRLAGGIGGRGPGETKLETDRRRVRDRIHRLEVELASQRKRREQRRKERLRHEVPAISIVGYTNAGKSTLLNALTSSHVLAEARMFATLDPTTRRLRLPRDQEVIINDTVGFIRDLPPDLLAAFRSTLEEISGSRLLLHVVDASNPRWEQQTASVDRILRDLEFDKIPRLLVFNKADLVDRTSLDAMLRQTSNQQGGASVAISALDQNSLGGLLGRISEALGPAMAHYQASEQPTETVQ
ncbi:MAG: GTPase [Blastocatellia bacterium]|jgi:GTP-binding protein HflX|nr:GTPase [Blastocatellia bacterium]